VKKMGREVVPSSQNATTTAASTPAKTALSLLVYKAHEEAGDPGGGSMLEEALDRTIFV
jgi:hypothetical protein